MIIEYQSNRMENRLIMAGFFIIFAAFYQAKPPNSI